MRWAIALTVMTLVGCGGENGRPAILGIDGEARRDGGTNAKTDGSVPYDSGPPAPESTMACETVLAHTPSRRAGAVHGGFTRVTAIENTLRSVAAHFSGRPDGVSATLIADLDRDGHEDILFNDQRDYCGGLGQTTPSKVSIARQTAGGTIGPAVVIDGLSFCQAAVDLDGDDWLDLVCAKVTSNGGQAGGGRVIAWGSSEGFSAERVTEIAAPSSVMAAGAWDLDDDGALDLVLSSWGQQSVVLRNLGRRRFEDVTSPWGVMVEGNTFQAGFFDVDGDGVTDLFTSDDGDQHQNRAFRRTRGDGDVEPKFERVRPTQEACDPQGFFGLSNQTAMGMALGDFDGDGDVEVVLTTGPAVPVLSRRRAPPFNWIDIQHSLGLDEETTTTGSFLVPWTPVVWDMDHDGWLDLWIATGDDQGFAMMPNRGQSRVLVYRGTPGGGFAEQSTELGVLSRGEYGYIQLGDLDSDGDLDVTVGAFGGAPEVYRNDLTNVGRHTVLSLHGTVSNPHGLGATVTVAQSPRVYPIGDRWGSWGTAQPIVDLTLPADPAQDSLTIHWPSGCTQILHGPFTTASVHATEPVWLTIDGGPHHRVSSANVNITVVPELWSTGTVGPVEITAVESTAVWAGPTVRDSTGRWSRELVAPTSPSRVTVRVQLAGVTASARPRVWFE